MPQKAISSDTLAAAVREYLGLSQAELASYLGITRGQVAHVEAGRRLLLGEASRTLSQLARLLPFPIGEADPIPAPEPPAEAPTAVPLRQRLAHCQWEAANRRMELEALDDRMAQARCWQRLIPAWRAVLPAAATAAQAARRHRLLDAWAARALAELDADAVAARVLLVVRIQGLETEIAALQNLLAQ